MVPSPGGYQKNSQILLQSENMAASLAGIEQVWNQFIPSIPFQYAFLEDEIAAMGMVVGAGWAGARSMTATSGPGVSLMAELA